jgi:DNA-3-methyladenine glycosylase II
MDLLGTASITVDAEYSLAQTAAPVAWGAGRWPNHDWIDRHLISVAQGESGPLVRRVSQRGNTLTIESNDRHADHRSWAEHVLSLRRTPVVASDPVIAALAGQFAGMRPWCNAGFFEAIATAIIGQSISVQAAAVTERKLCALFSEPVTFAGRDFWPFPSAEAIARAEPAFVRQCGVTQRRADALVDIAQRSVNGDLLAIEAALTDIAGTIAALMQLPMIGRWTAESILLWGIGAADAHPTGDVALLRAARRAYKRPEMTLKDLDLLAESWRPGRSWAARYLWLGLFGSAPGD